MAVNRGGRKNEVGKGTSNMENFSKNQPDAGTIAKSGNLQTVADVAALLSLRPEKVGGKIEYHGANPTGNGATKDGFILFLAGNATDRNGTKYTSKEVAQMAGISPDEYEPFALWKSGRGIGVAAPDRNRNGATPGHTGAAARDERARDTKPTSAPKGTPFDWKGALKFDYTDERGALLFQVGRSGDGAAKEIRQRRQNPNGRAGAWLYSLGDVRRVLWRLPDVIEAETVFICEGEKAAAALNNALELAGIGGDCVATTNPQGAGKWRDEMAQPLAGKSVCVLPDFDEIGAKHAAAVCNSIRATGAAASLVRLDLPELPHKGDVADWLEAGGTVARLFELRDELPEWAPDFDERGADGAPEPPAKARLIPIGELRKRPAPKWLIQRFLVQRATSLFTADSGSYKSFVALHIAYCVAHGLEFFGRGVRSGAVVYVAGEGGDGIRARSMAWDIHHKRDAPANLFVWESAVQIARDSDVSDFLAEIEASGVQPSAIIFDTLNRCAEGLEENSAKDMGLFCAGLERIKRATGAHCCVVHHNNAGGKSRGSTALPGAFETRFSAERDGSIVTLRCQKQKDGAPEFEPFALEAHAVEIGETDEYGDPITSLILEASDLIPTSEKPENGRGKAKERTCAAIIEKLAELRDKSDGAKVSKTQWEEAVTSAGICSRSVFYERVKETENARWYWCFGDCQIIEIEPESPVSPVSPKSPVSDVSDASELEKSGKSGKSGATVSSRTNRTNRTNPADSEPYAQNSDGENQTGAALPFGDDADEVRI